MFSLSNIKPGIGFFLIFQWGSVIFQWAQNFILNISPETRRRFLDLGLWYRGAKITRIGT